MVTTRPDARRPDAGKTTQVIGRVTKVVWDRVGGSLTVEFDPQPFTRIAVGDAVRIDLHPRPAEPPSPGETR